MDELADSSPVLHEPAILRGRLAESGYLFFRGLAKSGCTPAAGPGRNAVMLRGELAGLRARHDSDIPVLHAGLYDDVATRVRADSRPWQPIPPGPASPYRVAGPDDRVAHFSVVELATGELAGEALLWSIDPHNRAGHVGISLLPAFRGRGLGTDVVQVLCHYGFALRGLQRLQVETLADNDAMIATAAAAGFVREGTLRRSAWVSGEFADEVILGLLAAEWKRRSPGAGMSRAGS
ncbi:MAG TPA: GNAT family protein [Trebonia sp.]|nr:GNAT family protein [Trebonia sp.]